MLSRFCGRMLLEKNIISQNDLDIYIYGFELIFTTLLSAVGILCLALLWGMLTSGVIFIFVFFIMRTFSGGYHAETHIGCLVITNAAFLCSDMLGVALVILPVFIRVLILALASGWILHYAPVIHPNQPLNERKYKKNRKHCRLCLYLIIFIIALLCGLELVQYACAVESAVVMVCVMMIIKPKRRKKYVEVA